MTSFRQSFWLTICAETWWTAVWELPSVRFNSSRLEALVVVATCGCGSSLVVAVLRSPFSCVTCSPPSSPVFVSVLLLLFESRDFWLLAKFSSRCSSILWIWGDQWGFDPVAFKTAEVEKRDWGELELRVKDFLGDLKIPECLKINWTTTWSWRLAGSLLSWSKLLALVSRGSKKINELKMLICF